MNCEEEQMIVDRPTLKINFVREYSLDTRWSVIITDFIEELKSHFNYLTIREVARKIRSSAAIDRWQKHDTESKFTGHFRRLVEYDNDLDSYYRWLDSFPETLDERLGGYVGPRSRG